VLPDVAWDVLLVMEGAETLAEGFLSWSTGDRGAMGEMGDGGDVGEAGMTMGGTGVAFSERPLRGGVGGHTTNASSSEANVATPNVGVANMDGVGVADDDLELDLSLPLEGDPNGRLVVGERGDTVGECGEAVGDCGCAGVCPLKSMGVDAIAGEDAADARRTVPTIGEVRGDTKLGMSASLGVLGVWGVLGGGRRGGGRADGGAGNDRDEPNGRPEAPPLIVRPPNGAISSVSSSSV